MYFTLLFFTYPQKREIKVCGKKGREKRSRKSKKVVDNFSVKK